MSSSSDSEDDLRLKQILESTDSTLLNNDMFKNTFEEQKTSTIDMSAQLKSQRHLDESNDFGTDINLPKNIQQHMYKKFVEKIAGEIEFYENKSNTPPSKNYKSKVKLISGANCYVKPYEEFMYDTISRTKRVTINIRQVDKHKLNEQQCLAAAAVTTNSILNGEDLKFWTEKRLRNHKYFEYKLKKDGKLHLQEVDNEFSQLRRKNQWSESKIKQKLRTNKTV